MNEEAVEIESVNSGLLSAVHEKAGGERTFTAEL